MESLDNPKDTSWESLCSAALLTEAVNRLSSPSSYVRIPNRTLLPVPGVCGDRKIPTFRGRGVYTAPACMVVTRQPFMNVGVR